MYFVPDGTEICGFYECSECGTRFLHLQRVPAMVCPYCGEETDNEIGLDDEPQEPDESAVLLQVIEGAEEVERYDALLSLAQTGGNFEWI